MRKREKYINFATSRMCSDDKTVNVYSSIVALVPHNECADGYVVLTRVIVHEKVHAPPPPNRDLRQGRMDCPTEIYLVRQSPQVAQRQIICYRLSAMESK